MEYCTSTGHQGVIIVTQMYSAEVCLFASRWKSIRHAIVAVVFMLLLLIYVLLRTSVANGGLCAEGFGEVVIMGMVTMENESHQRLRVEWSFMVETVLSECQ